jgi:Protein of unknown function (DUF1580)
MIDSANETLITLANAAKLIPRRRRGRKTHVSTLFRWTTIGRRGVVLESIQVGGTRCTSREAMQRFFERLSESRQVGAVGGQPGSIARRRTIAERQRQSAEAGRKLAELGA